LAVNLISFFKREGELELRIRGNGVIRKTWEDIKRESGGSLTRFPWLGEQEIESLSQAGSLRRHRS
jgi:hypothetical protein